MGLKELTVLYIFVTPPPKSPLIVLFCNSVSFNAREDFRTYFLQSSSYQYISSIHFLSHSALVMIMRHCIWMFHRLYWMLQRLYCFHLKIIASLAPDRAEVGAEAKAD
jgi:hypothetical protein